MVYSRVDIIHQEDKVSKIYSRLNSNNEVEILTWLHCLGFAFERISGVECHDIGDQDYFSGGINTNDLDEIAEFVKGLYGEWSLRSVYQGIPISIRKPYPNVNTGLYFCYPGKSEEAVMPIFEEFQNKFCYPDITYSEVYR